MQIAGKKPSTGTPSVGTVAGHLNKPGMQVRVVLSTRKEQWTLSRSS